MAVSKKNKLTKKQQLAAPGFPIADGMVVKFVEIAQVKEQDVNPQVMQPQEFDRLTENIRERGMIESLPYCYQKGGEGQIEVVSGHHRLRAARAAGLEVVPAIVDHISMTRSELASKQIAHNRLVGEPDSDVMAELLKTITRNVDDLLRTGLHKDELPTVEKITMSLDAPRADFDFRTVTFTFLAHQLTEFEDVIESIPASDLVGVAEREQFDEFASAIAGFIRVKDVRHIGTVLTLLTKIAMAEIAEHEDNDDDA